MSTPPGFLVPKIDPSLYAWYMHPGTPGLYLRRALGLETKWVHQLPQNRQLFLSGTISFKSPLSSLEFHSSVGQAWLRLRFEFPEVVLKSSGDVDTDGSAIMECRIPRSEQEAKEWAARTLFLGNATLNAQIASNAEDEIGMEVVADPVCARLNSIICPTSGSEPVVGAKFCFRVDHLLADGMGVYILVGNFLRIFAQMVGGDKYGKIEWEKARGNIPEPWILMMNAKQTFTGTDFEEKVRKHTELVLASIESECGLKVASVKGYKPMHGQKAFSSEQSKTILRSVKAEIGPGGSVTHLGHAAMAMTLLNFEAARDRPSNNERFVSPALMSGRRYLDPKRPKSTDHVPMCRAIGAIEFRDVDRYLLSKDEGKQDVREKLKLACEDSKRSYEAIREQESILTESIAVAEFMGTAKNAIKGKGLIAPLFLSDGIVERYLGRSYMDKGGSTQVLSVDDVRFKANPDGPPMIIRMYTFRDTIRLAAEWDATCYAERDAQRFLDSVAELMLGLT